MPHDVHFIAKPTNRITSFGKWANSFASPEPESDRLVFFSGASKDAEIL